MSSVPIGASLGAPDSCGQLPHGAQPKRRPNSYLNGGTAKLTPQAVIQ